MRQTPELSRRGFLRSSAAVAAAAAFSGTLAACSSSTGSAGKPQTGKVTLTVMDTDPTASDIAAFEKAYPDIKINQITYDLSRLTASIAAGNPPDVVRGLGAVDTPYIATQGLAAPLDDYVAKSKLLPESDLDPVNDLWRFDTGSKKQGKGTRYGITKDYSQDNMFWFNPAVFAQAGIAVPSTTTPLSYDEWAALAEKVGKKQGGQVKVYGLDSGEGHLFQHFQAMVASAGADLFNSKLTAIDFSSPEGQSVLSWYLNLAKTGANMSVVNPAPPGGSSALLKANRLGMVDAGYWYTSGLATDKVGATCRLAPAPQFGSKRTSPTESATGAWITAKSQHKDEAWQFLEFFLGGAPAKQRATQGTGIPTRKSFRSLLPTSTPLEKEAWATQQAELPYLTTLNFTPYAKVDAIESAVNPILTTAIQSGQSVGKLADSLNSAVNALIQQGKQNAN